MLKDACTLYRLRWPLLLGVVCPLIADVGTVVFNVLSLCVEGEFQ